MIKLRLGLALTILVTSALCGFAQESVNEDRGHVSVVRLVRPEGSDHSWPSRLSTLHFLRPHGLVLDNPSSTQLTAADVIAASEVTGGDAGVADGGLSDSATARLRYVNACDAHCAGDAGCRDRCGECAGSVTTSVDRILCHWFRFFVADEAALYEITTHVRFRFTMGDSLLVEGPDVLRLEQQRAVEAPTGPTDIAIDRKNSLLYILYGNSISVADVHPNQATPNPDTGSLNYPMSTLVEGPNDQLPNPTALAFIDKQLFVIAASGLKLVTPVSPATVSDLVNSSESLPEGQSITGISTKNGIVLFTSGHVIQKINYFPPVIEVSNFYTPPSPEDLHGGIDTDRVQLYFIEGQNIVRMSSCQDDATPRTFISADRGTDPVALATDFFNPRRLAIFPGLAENPLAGGCDFTGNFDRMMLILAEVGIRDTAYSYQLWLAGDPGDWGSPQGPGD